MSSNRPLVVVAEHYSDGALQRLQAHAEVVAHKSTDRKTLLSSVARADALLVRTYTQVDLELLSAAPNLKIIGRAGVGLDNIDVTAAEARGIKVVHTPAASTQSVAELTIGLMLALERHIAAGHAAVLAGEFHEARRRLVGRELQGLTLGIIGLGRIGKAVARIAHHGLGMKIIYNDIAEMGWQDFVATRVEKPDLYSQADVMTLHVPLTVHTRHLIDSQVLSTFKPTTTLINTSRGTVINSMALVDALQSKSLGGAALDVTDPEPLPLEHPLRKCERLILTPHLASRTHRSIQNMEGVVEDLLVALQKCI